MGNGQSQQAIPNDCMTFKIKTIGNSFVGKTSLLWRYMDDRFTSENWSCLIDYRIQQLHIDGQDIKLQLWDTAGQERFRTMTRSYFRGSHGLLVVFDMTDVESFEAVKKWIEDAVDVCGDDITKVLVGNKSDLTDLRRVKYETAKEFADEMGMPYFETSAKTGTNVQEAFAKMISVLKSRVDDGSLDLTEPAFRVRDEKTNGTFGECSC